MSFLLLKIKSKFNLFILTYNLKLLFIYLLWESKTVTDELCWVQVGPIQTHFANFTQWFLVHQFVRRFCLLWSIILFYFFPSSIFAPLRKKEVNHMPLIALRVIHPSWPSPNYFKLGGGAPNLLDPALGPTTIIEVEILKPVTYRKGGISTDESHHPTMYLCLLCMRSSHLWLLPIPLSSPYLSSNKNITTGDVWQGSIIWHTLPSSYG